HGYPISRPGPADIERELITQIWVRSTVSPVRHPPSLEGGRIPDEPPFVQKIKLPGITNMHFLSLREEKSQRNQSWKAIFISTYSDLGRYIRCYATLKKAWDDLEKYLGQRCPRMIGSLKESVREEDLDAVEAQIGCKLPDDYRCSFRIHNGQKLVVPGLMGSMALSNHYRSEDLLDIDTAAGGFQQRLGLKQCLPLTFCIHTGLSQYMALESVEGRNKYEIFYQCP
ncbi:PREDICTED: F-box only protein 3-like, partial [Eurypyga helias]|uniref:F-box only protein 3-like n=1 Tax=Eurypyga helias TaxID=54383 RepID=UPI0005289FC1